MFKLTIRLIKASTFLASISSETPRIHHGYHHEDGGLIGEGFLLVKVFANVEGMEGILLTLSVVARHTFTSPRRQMRVFAPMIGTAILMFSFSTVKLAVDGCNVIVAFEFVKYNTRAERIAYLSDVSQPWWLSSML